MSGEAKGVPTIKKKGFQFPDRNRHKELKVKEKPIHKCKTGKKEGGELLRQKKERHSRVDIQIT